MYSEMFFKNQRGEPYKIVITTENDKDINCLLDQLKTMKYTETKIKPEEFILNKPVTIDIFDESNSYKIGEMTLEDFSITDVGSGFTFT